MNKIENINLLPDTEPDSGDYTGEDGLLYCGTVSYTHLTLPTICSV